MVLVMRGMVMRVMGMMVMVGKRVNCSAVQHQVK
jgi:hypothetical protein